MKKLILLAFTLTAFAEEGGMPPNPFQNIPNENSNFDPFSDDFDDHGFDDEPYVAPPIPKGAGGPTSQKGTEKIAPPASSNHSNSGDSDRLDRPGKKQGSTASFIDSTSSKEIVESFDYPDSEILDVAKAVSKLTGKNFIYNPQDIKGRISIVSNTAITVADAYNAFLAALNMKGFALVPSGKYLRIERVASAKEKQTPIYASKGAPANEEFITRVVPLRYIDASEVEQTFRMWMPREARLQAYAQTNTLIITDTATHINRMLELISLLDVAGYQESLAVIQIRNAAAKDVAKLIEQIISDGSKNNQQNRFGAAPRPTPSFGTSLRSTSTGRQGGMQISKIIADERTNTLIVKANAVGINEIKALVKKLDTKVAVASGTGRIHVVRLQFANAEELAKIVTAVTQGAGKSSNNNRFGSYSPFGNGPGGAAPDASNVFQSEIKISADKFTQSLVVTASPADFNTLKKVIETLDVPRDQVFVQAVIMEIAMNRDSKFGTSFVSAPNGIALPSSSGTLDQVLAGNPLGVGGFVLGFKSGQGREFTVGSGSTAKTMVLNTVNGLIDLIQSNADANIVATPQLIALDNQESEITISEMIPQEDSNITSSGSINKTYKENEAKLYLKVKPQINKGSDFVKLDIEQTLQDFTNANVPDALRNVVRGKNTRQTKTSVIVQNEDSVVISGLIKDTVNETVNKVPILGDIPVLGWLFKNKKTDARKSNLIVFMTPTIIKQYDSIRKILNSRISKRDEFVRESLGSQDPMRATIEELKASLPPLSKLNPLPKAEIIESKSFNAPTPAEEPQPESNDLEPWNDSTNQPFITPPQDIGPNYMDNNNPPPVMPNDNPGAYQ